MRVFNIFFIVIFVLFAALQYNDPDPHIWIPIYLFAAFLCYKACTGKYHPYLYIAGLILFIGYAIYLFFDASGVLNWMTVHESESIVQSMKAEKPWIEETREFGGLLMIIVVLLINMFWMRKHHKSIASNTQ